MTTLDIDIKYNNALNAITAYCVYSGVKIPTLKDNLQELYDEQDPEKRKTMFFKLNKVLHRIRETKQQKKDNELFERACHALYFLAGKRPTL